MAKWTETLNSWTNTLRNLTLFYSISNCAISNRCMQAAICCDPMPMNATTGSNQWNKPFSDHDNHGIWTWLRLQCSLPRQCPAEQTQSAEWAKTLSVAKTVPIVIFNFNLMLWKWSNNTKIYKNYSKNAHFFRVAQSIKSCSKSKRLLKIEKLLKSFRVEYICLGLLKSSLKSPNKKNNNKTVHT